MADETKLTHPANLRRLQAASGLVMSSFMAVHIPTSISAIMGPYGYNEALRFFRKYYQNPFVEIGLLTSLGLHIGSSWLLYKHRSELHKGFSEPWHVRWNRYAGRILALVVPVHVAATRLFSFLPEGRPADYDQVRASLTGRSALFFVPYYAIFSAAGVFHAIQGLLLSLSRLQVIPATWHAKYASHWLTLSSIIATAAGVYAGIYSFSTIEGIPESFEQWKQQGLIPPSLHRGTLLQF